MFNVKSLLQKELENTSILLVRNLWTGCLGLPLSLGLLQLTADIVIRWKIFYVIQLEDYIPEVEEFYRKNHSGRKLQWHHLMSNGVVSVCFFISLSFYYYVQAVSTDLILGQSETVESRPFWLGLQLPSNVTHRADVMVTCKVWKCSRVLALSFSWSVRMGYSSGASRKAALSMAEWFLEVS